jgi:hypothetical protein
MSTTDIAKISLKKGKPTIEGVEYYPNGATKEFKVPGVDIVEGVIAAMSGLLDTLIGSCYLADDWEKAEVTGITVKPVDGKYGIVITGQLKVEESGDAYVVVMNSPYLSPERLTASEQMAIKRTLTSANDYLEAMPKQLKLEVAA